MPLNKLDFTVEMLLKSISKASTTFVNRAIKNQIVNLDKHAKKVNMLKFIRVQMIKHTMEGV